MKCRGGPFNGQNIYFETFVTLCFTARGMTGHYYTLDGHNAMWVERDEPLPGILLARIPPAEFRLEP